MRIGFTGTRRGMTAAQRATVAKILADLKPSEVCHGDCVGADAEFAGLCDALVPRPRIAARPGESAKGGENHLRANSPHNDEVLPTKTHFARNRDIVDWCGVLIGAPGEMARQDRGGTWYTIDHAGKKGRHRLVVLPDGTLAEDGAAS